MRALSLGVIGSLMLVASCGRPAVSQVQLPDGPLVPVSGDGVVKLDRAPLTDGGPVLDHRLDGAPPAKLPDLVFADFTAAVNGGTVTYNLKVCNNGTADAPSFGVDLTYNAAAAPKAKQPGDQAQAQKPLGKGACIPITLTRTNAPNGTFKSWAQLDTVQAVPELDENNNVAGPVTVAVNVPPMPDLIIKQFDAQVSGASIGYNVSVCNVGTAAAFLFRVDVYYSRLLAPGPLQVGDVSHYVLFLAAGGCESFSVTYQNAPVGLYNSWALADVLGTVKESDENNNVGGPKLISITPPADCIGTCLFATNCGDFKLTEYPQCLSWCNALNATDKACLLAAQQAQSCKDIKQCKLPAPPPPPPPPWDCLPLCQYEINTCKLLPSSALVTCVAGCLTLPQTKLQCAVDAMNKQQCIQVGLCLL
jgi:hypothetical protein